MEKMMRAGVPWAFILLGSILGGMSMFRQEKEGTDVLVAEQIPNGSSPAMDCGATSLYVICRISETSSSLEEIRKLTKTSLTGTSMYDIKEAAEQLGFRARGSKCSFEFLGDYLSQQGHYGILFFKSGHFNPAVQIFDGKIRTLDTSRLEMKDCSEEDLNSMGWDKTALLLQK